MVRRRVCAIGLAMWLGLSLVLAGCGQPGGARRFTGEFERVELTEAPPQIQVLYEQLKGAPGLHVLEQQSGTYLLLTAGRSEQPGLELEVMEVRRPAGDSRDARVLARLRPSKGTGEYPYAVLRLEQARGLRFTARVSTLSERVLDLTGLPVVDR